MDGIDKENFPFVWLSNASSREWYHDNLNIKFCCEGAFYLLNFEEKVSSFHAQLMEFILPY